MLSDKMIILKSDCILGEIKKIIRFKFKSLYNGKLKMSFWFLSGIEEGEKEKVVCSIYENYCDCKSSWETRI